MAGSLGVIVLLIIGFGLDLGAFVGCLIKAGRLEIIMFLKNKFKLLLRKSKIGSYN